MREPRDLEVIDVALRLAELTYQLTKGYPPDERFGLVAQMRRAAVSTGSNIAEGCGRSTDRAFANFLEMALGSVLELMYQAHVASRLGHGDPERTRELLTVASQLKRMLASLAGAVRRKKLTGSPAPVRQREASAAP